MISAQSSSQLLEKELLISKDDKNVLFRNWNYKFSLEQLNELYWLICSLLNTKNGGNIYIGVNENAEWKGIPLTKEEKDELEREISYSLEKLSPELEFESYITVTFIHIEKMNYVVKIHVKEGEPGRVYTRLITPFWKIKTTLRTAAQVRQIGVDLNHLKIVDCGDEDGSIKFASNPEKLKTKENLKNTNCRELRKKILEDQVSLEKKISEIKRMETKDLENKSDDLAKIVELVDRINDLVRLTNCDIDEMKINHEQKGNRYII